jgi:hypothetical protein
MPRRMLQFFTCLRIQERQIEESGRDSCYTVSTLHLNAFYRESCNGRYRRREA